MPLSRAGKDAAGRTGGDFLQGSAVFVQARVGTVGEAADLGFRSTMYPTPNPQGGGRLPLALTSGNCLSFSAK
ncbi:hypothetical protein MESS2_1270033 [Mesorhizobium metallidurans STM 2683]|uniref:Uncharacterized protein n=1 Tax=Mesorhizobium metallidurans STM 2683 TaxID=1297569 RepID=M5EJU7_9HYPH|nr:hypothetical protein MESS2_1270033 [Mesorhizobium metallidurans STM 2683]